MMRLIAMAALLVLGASTARAEDSPPARQPVPPAAPAPAPAAKPLEKPLTPEQAADAVLAALKVKDDAALNALAAKDDPDPWLVADELIRRGEHDVAEAFARAAPRVDVEKLPEYVASRRGKADDPARRARLAGANAALVAGKPDEVLGALDSPEAGSIEDVVGVRLVMARGLGLAALLRPQASAAAFLAAGDAARRLGWLARASRALRESGVAAYRGLEFVAARDAWVELLSVSEQRADKEGSARTLDDIGNVYDALGDCAKAMAGYERALSMKEALGDKAGAASTLVLIGNVNRKFGDYAKALTTYERAVSMKEALGDKAGAAVALGNIGIVYSCIGDYARALTMLERALVAKEALGDKVGAATTLSNIGNVHFSLGDYAKALATMERALVAQEALEDKLGAAATLGNIGSVYYEFGEYEKALSAMERALVARDALGDRLGAATTLGNIGNVYNALGDLDRALATYERALAAKETLGDKAGAATTLGNIGNVYRARGDFAKARTMLERALLVQEALGDRAGAATTLGNIGNAYDALGDFAKALTTMERALLAKEALGDKVGAATTLGNIGNVYDALGDFAKARTTLERALLAQQALGDKVGEATTLGNLGNVYYEFGDYAKSLETYERALAMKEALGDKVGAAATLGNIGGVCYARGDFTRALAIMDRALAAKDALGDQAGAAITLGNIGNAYFRLRDYVKAIATLARALAAQEALGDKSAAANTLAVIAGARYALGDWPAAVDAARRGAALVPFLVSGLGDEQGATARVHHADLFAAGARAAAEVRDVGSVLEFVERGRAGSLLEALGARASLQSGLVPPVLAAEEAQAHAKEGVASQAYRRALDGGDFKAVQARRRELDEAQAVVVASVERIQRESKSAANVVHFKPDELDVIRKRLAPDEALVLYCLFDEGPLALAVTPAGATTAKLPATKDIEASCETLLQAIRDHQDTEAASRAADALRDLVVKTLGLAPETKRLLVSPDGALSYVPFALLAPDREVVYVPSGTTYGLLLEDGKARGEGVLALGDPDYGSKVDERAAGIYTRGSVGRLERLPATADEARTVGATVLLGKNATEKGLRDAVAKRTRWRSVHFACHGLIDAERPGFSSLALTSDGDDDGFLTVLEVFRSKIPADLVVLSACETAKGKVVKGEGIMGLTRAFMFAGSPRVICSLWKVDDAATKALMVKFYELWNPKDPAKAMGTAAALKAAQEYIRTYETEVPDMDASQREGRAVTKRVRPWEHPYYWAAWVLWGLPD